MYLRRTYARLFTARAKLLVFNKRPFRSIIEVLSRVLVRERILPVDASDETTVVIPVARPLLGVHTPVIALTQAVQHPPKRRERLGRGRSQQRLGNRLLCAPPKCIIALISSKEIAAGEERAQHWGLLGQPCRRGHVTFAT